MKSEPGASCVGETLPVCAGRTDGGDIGPGPAEELLWLEASGARVQSRPGFGANPLLAGVGRVC